MYITVTGKFDSTRLIQTTKIQKKNSLCVHPRTIDKSSELTGKHGFGFSHPLDRWVDRIHVVCPVLALDVNSRKLARIKKGETTENTADESHMSKSTPFRTKA